MILQSKTPWFSHECPVPLQIKFTVHAIHVINNKMWDNTKTSTTCIQCLISNKKDLPAFNTHNNRTLSTYSHLWFSSTFLMSSYQQWLDYSITQNCRSYNILSLGRSTLKILVVFTVCQQKYYSGPSKMLSLLFSLAVSITHSICVTESVTSSTCVSHS